MRIATGGFYHETNRFGNILVTPAMVKSRSWSKQEWLNHYTGVHSYSGGFIDEAQALGVEIVPAVDAHISPCGPIQKESLEMCRDQLVDLLWEAYQEQPFDAIALNLHGAAYAEGYPDAESEVLRALREKFGYEMPIGAVLDLHGNVTEESVRLCDILIGVKGYPHVDEYDEARIMFRLLCDMAQNNWRPCKQIIRLPWFIAPGQGVTTAGPAHDIQQLLYAQEASDPDLLQATFFHGFPYADFPGAGVSIVTMAKTQESADRAARTIAEYAWSRRQDFKIPLYTAEEAVDHALEFAEGPIIINESSDNPGGGTPADGTHLLRELLRRNLPGTAFGFIYDPEVAKQATAAGVGATIRCTLGGKTDDLHGAPIEIENAYVKTISDGKFVQKAPMSAGAKCNYGPTVCLMVGNVAVVVSSARTQTMDDGPFRIAGVDWREMRILAMKSSQHFKGWWADKVKGIVPCESPGIHSSNLALFQFKDANTSYYPLQDAQWN